MQRVAGDSAPAKADEDDVRTLRDLFNLFDHDGSGDISHREVDRILDMLGVAMPAAEVKEMIADVDSNHDGKVSFDEFKALMCAAAPSPFDSEEVLDAFKAFVSPLDQVPAGHIMVDAIRKALCTYTAEKLTHAQADELMAQLVPEGRSFANYRQFVRMRTDDPAAKADAARRREGAEASTLE